VSSAFSVVFSYQKIRKSFMHKRALEISENSPRKNYSSIATFSIKPRPPSQNKPRGRGEGDGEAREGGYEEEGRGFWEFSLLI
jgi:hypothetical protein